MERRSVLEHDPEIRAVMWRRLAALIEAHGARIASDPHASLVPSRSPEELAADARGLVRGASEGSGDPVASIEAAFRALEEGIVHVDHPRYFGLFHSAPSALGTIADALASAFNPQLATTGHAPWPIAIEDELVATLGERFGWPARGTFGAFTSGGAEANMTALACALSAAFPEIGRRGVRALPGAPRLYVSSEGHATMTRAARLAGLGSDSVCTVPADARQRMKSGALAQAIAGDRARGAWPFLVVATAGTTSSGAIDPLRDVAAVAARERCWFHVDAAWGGLAALVPELRPALDGIADADSITFDAHKVMSAPMGTGTFLTRREGILERVFDVRSGYMPRSRGTDPYGRSMQWSRRFLGIRILLPLVAVGWEGFATSLRRQVALAGRLRDGLARHGWTVVNDTPLPIVCFVDATDPRGRSASFLDGVARSVIARGDGWISVPRLANGARALRACMNNHRTEEADVDRLLEGLAAARTDARARLAACVPE